MPRRTGLLIVVILAAVLLGAAVGALTYAGLGGKTTTVVHDVVTAGQPTAASTTQSSVGAVYRKVQNGVVEITATTTSGSSNFGFGGSTQTQEAQGSGFVYDTSGHIVTSEHVIDGATSISIRFPNGSKYKATLVGADTSTDLAVLQVDAPAERAGADPARRLDGAPGRRRGGRDRQPVRARGDGHLRDRERAAPRDHRAEPGDDHRRDPDRRADQQRQLGRPAPEHGRPRSSG